MSISFHSGIAGSISRDQFFDGWTRKVTDREFTEMIDKSTIVISARDDDTGKVCGLITAITDGALCAYLPFLEVGIDYRGRGIGSLLVRKMLERLPEYYMIDLVCDEELRGFYEKFGFKPSFSMSIRNYSAGDKLVNASR